MYKYNGKEYTEVDIEEYPDCDVVEFEEIERIDISQGTGNVIVKYLYMPESDTICRYVDY